MKILQWRFSSKILSKKWCFGGFMGENFEFSRCEPARKSIPAETRRLVQKRRRYSQKCVLQSLARNPQPKNKKNLWTLYFTPLPGRPHRTLDPHRIDIYAVGCTSAEQTFTLYSVRLPNQMSPVIDELSVSWQEAVRHMVYHWAHWHKTSTSVCRSSRSRSRFIYVTCFNQLILWDPPVNYYSISRRQGSTFNPKHSVSRQQLSWNSVSS